MSGTVSSFVKHALSVEQEPSPRSRSFVDSSDSYSEASFRTTASSSDEPPATNHPFYRLPTHPLILPPSALNRKLKPAPFFEVWDAANIKPFIVEVMGALPTTHNYYEGIHLCRTIFVSKYGFGRYMDNMSLFWAAFHESYAGRDIDPHSASWSRWRHDRMMELEHVLSHSYVWGSDEAGSYLEEYISFRPGDSGATFAEDQLYLRNFGAKVTRFEVGWIGIENCNPEWAEDVVEATIPTRIPRFSSPRLSSDFTISSLSLASTNIHTALHGSGRNRYHEERITQAPQWESVNQTRALKLFAQRKHRTLSQSSRREYQEEERRAVSIHRSQSVWKEAKHIFLHRSHSSKKRNVSGPINITRGPSIPVTLLPISCPAPELSRKSAPFHPKTTLPLGTLDPSTAAEGNWRPVALLPKTIQGSLYGQLEDLLALAVNKFLRDQVSLLNEDSLARELSAFEDGNDGRGWFRHLRDRFAAIGKGKESNKPFWFHEQQWGIIAGHRLVQANTGSLQFYGNNSATPASVLGYWAQLNSEAFCGRRTIFDDSTVMRHLDTVEQVLDLLGQLIILQEFKKKRHEIWMLIKQSWPEVDPFTRPRVATGNTEPQMPMRGASVLSRVEFSLTRSSSLPRFSKGRSLNNVSPIWNDAEGSYAITPALPLLEGSQPMESPCIGKGKGKGRAWRNFELTQERSEDDRNVNWDQLQRKENERLKTLQSLLGKHKRQPYDHPTGDGGEDEGDASIENERSIGSERI